MSGAGPVGYLFHNSSKFLVHPMGGSYNPPSGTELCLSSKTEGPGRLQYRWVPCSTDYGYIEHVSSGLVVRTAGTLYSYSYSHSQKYNYIATV